MTWTDLAAGGQFGKGAESGRQGSRRENQRPGSRQSGKTVGGLKINDEVAEFTLANQEEKYQSYEEIDEDNFNKPEEIEDEDAP